MSEDTPAPTPEPPPEALPVDPGPVPEPTPEPEPTAEPTPEPGPAPEPVLERKPRRRGRTTLLIAAAAVLGVLAGAGTGYKIQQDRPETPLPPLAQPKLVQPAGAAPASAPLTAADDHLVKVDGDLRKLLVERPKGAKEPEYPIGSDGWSVLADFADSFKSPDHMFVEMAGNGFRRSAVTAWEGDNHTVTEVRLIQFRDDTRAFAVEMLRDQQEYMPDADYAANEGTAIPGDLDGRVWVYSEPETKEGYEPVYTARGLARRGNIVMEVQIYSIKPISTATILDVSKRQLERL
ncbi:hypothetical protein ABZ721_17000 [Streptomyces sp. NPDC006733]|uniref:hypothetical protein n=1 Tax=Streptomyces sp. NPDC006733 TaxID=3155460 RepID=UPI0033E19F43